MNSENFGFCLDIKCIKGLPFEKYQKDYFEEFLIKQEEIFMIMGQLKLFQIQYYFIKEALLNIKKKKLFIT